jgi:hypothetical protein
MSLREALTAIGNWCRETFDVRDAMLACGLGLLAAGLWQVWPPAALVVPGTIITAVAIFANRIDGNAKEG